jgi:hypothetical protein
LVLNGDLAGTYTDPNTGIVFAAFTNPMPEQKVLRDIPDLQLGQPSRMLEALSGISAVPRPCRQEIVNDFQDAVEGFMLPQGLLEMQVRSEASQREAREVFFTNREVEAGYNDTHWDGYIGTTFVLRPTYDTQTLRDNDETNTTVLPYRFNPDGNLAIPMYQDGTRWGGPMQPAVEVLAQDKAYGLPHINADFQIDNARQQFFDDSGFAGVEAYLSSNVGVTAQSPFDLTNLPRMASEKATRDSVVGANVVNVTTSPYDLTRLPQMASEKATRDSITGANLVNVTTSPYDLSRLPQMPGERATGDSIAGANVVNVVTSPFDLTRLPQMASERATGDSIAGANVVSMVASPFDLTRLPQMGSERATGDSIAGANVVSVVTSPFDLTRLPQMGSERATGDSIAGANVVSVVTSPFDLTRLPQMGSERATGDSMFIPAHAVPQLSNVPSSVTTPFSDSGYARDVTYSTQLRTQGTEGNVSLPFTQGEFSGDSSVAPGRNQVSMDGAASQPLVLRDSATAGDSRFVTEQLRQPYVPGTAQNLPGAGSTYGGDSRMASDMRFGYSAPSGQVTPMFTDQTNTSDSRASTMFRNLTLEDSRNLLPASSSFAGDSTVAPLRNTYVEAPLSAMPFVSTSTYAGDSTVATRQNGLQLQLANTGEGVPPLPVSYTYAGDATVHSRAMNVGGTETGGNLPGTYTMFAGDSTLQSQPTRPAAFSDEVGRSILPSYTSLGRGGERVSERASQVDVGASFNVPTAYGTDGNAGDSTLVQHFEKGARTVDNSALQSLQPAAPTYEGDSIVGAQRASVSQHDLTNGAALLPIMSDSSFTEKTSAPGRVSNSRTLFWTGQSIVQAEIPMYIQDPDKGDALHALDMYTSEERRFRNQNAAAQPAGAAEYRNVYESGGGWRKDEMDLWQGRSNGPSQHVITALLDNQLLHLAAASQEGRTCLWDASQTAYESDVGC